MESKLACWQFNSLEEGDCILLLIFLTLIFLCCNNSFAQQKDSSGIFVANIEFDMLTMVAVKCEGFASSMPKIMKHRHIDKKGSLAMLDSFLEKVKFQKKNNEIDVRGQVYYIKPGYAAKLISNSLIDETNKLKMK
jgi:hypothetical protein